VAYERDKEIVYRPLYESPIISVHDYCCHIERSGPGGEELSDSNNIVFTVSPRVLNDIVRELDPTIDEHPEQPFRFVTGPCDSGVFWRHRELVQRLEAADPLEPLWADVTALQLVADVLESAFVHGDGGASKPKREGTDVDHAERTEAAKTYLVARIFQKQTGVPVHRYLIQLRLRASSVIGRSTMAASR
jgi:hypothetical protein